MTITVERRGRRSYLVGNTYPIKDRLRAAGAKWDGDAKAWWMGDDAKAHEIADAVVTTTPTTEAGAPSHQAPGEDAVVAARATYHGKTYYVLGRVERGRTHYDDRVGVIATSDGSKMLLAFRDGSKSFWAARSEVQIIKSYGRPTTIGNLRRFAEEAKQARVQGNDDGIPDGRRYECEECGEYVVRGQGRCWETGAAH